MKPITIIRKSVLLLLFSLIIPTSAGVYLSIKEVTDPMTIYLINGRHAGWVSFTSIHYSKSRFHLKEIGFRKGSLGMWIFPILIIEAIPFIAGLNKDLTLSSFLALCFFMVCVGLFEEGIFRGILFQYLKQINLRTAIWGSAVLFGLGHLCESTKRKKHHINSGTNLIRLFIWIRCGWNRGTHKQPAMGDLMACRS